ncbi:MAG TPA: hypothetical protein VGE48_01460 [Candidatus Paceibacterota bacterium]
MFKVDTKFFFISLVGIALALIFWPFAGMHIFTTFNWWQIPVFWAVINLPGHIGHHILSNLWGRFELKMEARK